MLKTSEEIVYNIGQMDGIQLKSVAGFDERQEQSSIRADITAGGKYNCRFIGIDHRGCTVADSGGIAVREFVLNHEVTVFQQAPTP